MLTRILIASAVFAFSARAAELTPDDLRPRPWFQQDSMSREQRIELLSMLEKYGGRYLGELETVSFKSFEHIQGPGAIVASLVTEAEDSKIMMREFISRVKALQKDPDNIRSWLLLIRNFYVIADYAEDLNRRQIVKSTDYVGVRMLMPAVLDRILIPNAAAH